MAELPWLTALYPQRYTSSWSLPTGAIRLFGDGWAFCVVPAPLPTSPYGGADIVFRVVRFATPNRTSTNHQWHRRNVLALNYDQERFRPHTEGQPDDHFYTYNPVDNGTPAGAMSTPLVARFLSNGPGRPLYELLQGRIEVPQENSQAARIGRQRLLTALRRECGIRATEGTPQRSIFLYPDGICLFGRIAVPGQPTRLDGWFKIGTRAMAVPAAAVSEVGRGLSLCLDETLPGNAGLNGHIARWQGAFGTLRSAFSNTAFKGTKWLSAEDVGTAGPEALFWPGVNQAGQPDYFRRGADWPLHIDGGIARLRLCPDGLSVQPDRLEVDGDARELRFRSVAVPNSHAQDCPSLRYGYLRSQPDDEGIVVAGNRADRSKPCANNPQAVKLTVPLIETAQKLRRESGMPEGGEEGLDVLRPLWTFTQLDNGLLHWPFSDATAEALSALLEHAPEAPTTGAGVTRPDDPAGAILLGNRPDREGFRDDQRPWSVAVTECRDLAVYIKLVNDGGGFVLDKADILIGEHEMVIEGALQVIPFRQTRERLLPDHDERAMRSTSLRAVSPGLLQGLEQATQQRLRDQVGAVIEIEDLRLSPVTGISSGRVLFNVTLPCRTPAALLPSEDEVAAIRPWIWPWHDKIPTVQAHALAEAGTALSQPSGLRQLAPFRRLRGNRNLTYVFENALDPTRLAPLLRLDEQVGDGEGVYAAPEIDPHYAGEIGMAALTMPSVTFFPGHRDAGEAVIPDRLPEPGTVQPPHWLWPIGNQTLPFLVEMRQDIALRDEFYAQAAVAPEKADPAAGTPAAIPPQDRFEPLDTNGPQAWGGTAGELHSWKRLWAFRNRQAALAAAQPRALITRSGPRRLLANLLPQNAKRVDLKLRLERVGDNIGAVEIRDAAGTVIADMPGLPAAGDLEGVTGVIDGVTLQHGTARRALEGGNRSFTDQRGLTTSGVRRDGMTLSRLFGRATLVSCVSPLRASTPAGILPIDFWFADVPTPMEDDVATLARNDFEHNHLQGYRWAVSQSGRPDNSIGLGGCLDFVPLSLIEASGGAAVAGLKIKGFLEIRSGSGGVPQRADDAAASLALATNTMPVLDVGPDLVLRLTDPGVTGAAPVVLKILPPDRAVLHVELLGRNFEFALRQSTPLPTTPAHLAGVLPLDFALDAGQSDAPLALAAIKVRLSDPAGPQVILTYAFNFEVGEAVLTGEFDVDAITGTVEAKQATFTLPGLTISPSPVLRLTADSLLLTWHDVTPEALSVSGGLFDGAEVIAYGGHLVAALDGNLGVPALGFNLEFEIQFQTPVNGRPRRLVLTGTSAGLCLSGSATVVEGHGIELTWRGEILKRLADPSVTVATHAVHRLDEGEAGRVIVLPQYVVLAQSAAGLSVHCDTVAVSSTAPSTNWLIQVRAGNLTGAELAPLTAGQRTRALARLSEALAAGSGWVSDFLPTNGSPILRDLGLPALAQDWTPGEAYGLSPALAGALERAPHYSDVLAIFAKAQAGALMSAPRSPPQAADQSGYRLLAPDSNRRKFVNVGRFASDIVPASTGDFALRQWALAILADRAPWANSALLEILRADALPRSLVVDRDMGATENEGGSHKLGVRSRPQPSVFTARADAPVVADPRRIAVPSGAANLVGGFRPVHAAALTFTHRKDGVNEDLLSVRSMERAWRLDRAGDVGASAYGENAEYWLQDRTDTSFRNAASASAGRLAAQSSVDVPEMAGSGALYPVAADAAERVAAPPLLTQFVIPEYSVTREIAPRPGIAQVARLGLSGRNVASARSPEDKSAGAQAPEVPVHAFTPRPPLIGVNDRLRSDEFMTDVAAAIGLQPNFLLFGPCAEPPPRIAGRPGLDRKPLARDAVLVTLTNPERGAIDRSWDGHLEFALPANAARKIEAIWVSVDINGRHFHGNLLPGHDMKPISCFSITDVDAPGETLGGLLGGLVLSTRARFEIGFLVKPNAGSEDKRQIGRLAVLDLPVSARSASRIEQPRHFRFEDPEYNDLIERRFAVKRQDGMTVVVDRDKVRPDGTVVIVAGQDVPADWTPGLALKSFDEEGIPLPTPIPLAPPSPFGDKCWLIDCRRLAAAGPTTARPKPKPRGALLVMLAGAAPIAIEITEEEPFAKNPASLAVLQGLDAADRVPLFSSMSRPDLVELIDPHDLLDGMARYRSSYVWRLFAPSNQASYRLQKIGASGSMYLSQSLVV
ncbi:hypothetical protein [Rhizobium anhuiense]|uniref:hypothetical protein n=1 Tax=Rhizobium anhuiense TaxID=1184720 RepID=UPI0020CF2AE4|nr:hypothetical protein [Rhizobium anhuiense]UTS88156.1 hypothetical protein NE851_00735 [Rhizobium anhuiense bv. trifolii]